MAAYSDDSNKKILNDENALSGEEILTNFNYLDLDLKVKVAFIDTISDLDNYSGVIVNTANEGHEGKHWFLLFKLDGPQSYSFDSYGRNVDLIYASSEHPVPNFLKDCINSSPMQLQNVATNTCGMYILDFGHSLKKKNSVNAAWEQLTTFYLPINPSTGSTNQFIEMTTLRNDNICFDRVHRIFPNLRLVL